MAAFRLRRWPDLPGEWSTAPVWKCLSRMSLGPVSLDWFIAQTKLRPHIAEQLLEQLRQEGCVERFDLRRFPPERRAPGDLPSTAGQ